MIASQHISPGMTIALDGKVYRVESAIKVTVPKGTPFIKAKIKNLLTEETVEKSFKLQQTLEEVSLAERRLEFLYPEKPGYLFLDIDNFEQVLIPANILSDKVNYLKEGIEVKAMSYGDAILSIELPQFLELMVVKIEEASGASAAGATKVAVLETGAKVHVPMFIETGDIIKVDVFANEYVQRV